MSYIDTIRKALEAYADPNNWATDDESSAYRVWLEPDSSTPTAYDGYDLAQKALAEAGDVEQELSDKWCEYWKRFWLKTKHPESPDSSPVRSCETCRRWVVACDCQLSHPDEDRCKRDGYFYYQPAHGTGKEPLQVAPTEPRP